MIMKSPQLAACSKYPSQQQKTNDSTSNVRRKRSTASKTLCVDTRAPALCSLSSQLTAFAFERKMLAHGSEWTECSGERTDPTPLISLSCLDMLSKVPLLSLSCLSLKTSLKFCSKLTANRRDIKQSMRNFNQFAGANSEKLRGFHRLMFLSSTLFRFEIEHRMANTGSRNGRKQFFIHFSFSSLGFFVLIIMFVFMLANYAMLLSEHLSSCHIL
jgi:hypothetical protein